MTGPSFDALVYAWIGIALLSFVALLRVRAPYGRYTTETWGPTVPHRRGWILMEVVSPAAFLWFFLGGAGPKTGPAWVFAALWTAHYVNRAVIYPLRLPRSTRRMPVAIMLLAVVFNAMNGFLNGRYLGDSPVVYDVG